MSSRRKRTHSPATRAKMRAKALERWRDPVFRKKTIASLRVAHNRPDARENHRQAVLTRLRDCKRSRPRTA